MQNKQLNRSVFNFFINGNANVKAYKVLSWYCDIGIWSFQQCYYS